MGKSTSPWSLEVWLGTKGADPSFDPMDSDSISNAFFMENVVATLVKDAGRGRIEPYAAESWTESDDKKTIEFKLRRGLSFDDGTPLTAKGYVEGFNLLVKNYLTHSSPPVIENLVGFDDFKTGKNKVIRGVEARSESGSSDLIRFRFEKRASGFLEFLSMAYYGFYHPADFDQTGKWVDRGKIRASGPYRIQSREVAPDGKGLVSLERRYGHGLPLSSDAPMRVIFKAAPDQIPGTMGFNQPVIWNKRVTTENDLVPGMRLVKHSVGMLNVLAVSPFRGSPMDRIEFRRALRAWVFAFHEKNKKVFINASVAKGFYPILSGEAPQGEARPWMEKGKVDFIFALREGDPIRSYVEEMLRAFLPNSEVDFHAGDGSESNLAIKARGNRSFDVRVARVDAGGDYINWAVRMMFCSQLGVTFPDPSGSVCKLTDEYESDPSMGNQEVLARFQKIIDDEAWVIPLFHTSMSWLVAGPIDYEGVSLTQTVPRFDLLRLKGN